jgi:ankyrin repeat protein
LHYAIANSNLSNVQFLAEQWPASLLSEDPEGQSVLHIAVAQKGASFPIVSEADRRRRLDSHWWNGFDFPDRRRKRPRPPRFPIVEYLIEQRPQLLQATDKRGFLPLHAAVAQSEVSLDLVKLLLERFPGSAERKDKTGLLPLHVAAANGAPLDVVNLLTSKSLEAFTRT